LTITRCADTITDKTWKEVRELSNETDDSKKQWAVSGLFIPAGLFIGMGIGWALGYLVQGLLIGLGAGFLGMAIVRLVSGKR
jgi:hypothetical protein